MKKKLFALAFVSAGVALGATGCGNKNNREVDVKNSEDGVRKITVAHSQAYAPYDYIDENGVSDGYEVAVLKAIDELLSEYEFEFVGTNDDDLLIGVESGRYQIGTKGVWWTAARTESYVFPEHYIGSSITGLTFKTEYADWIKDMESFAGFSGRLVPLAPQNAQYTIVENYNKTHPDAQVELIAAEQFSNSDSYQWVLEGRYDAVFDIKTSYENNVVREGGEYHDYAAQLSYVAYKAIPTWPLFNRKEQELADAYDKAWETLYEDGTLEALQQEYFGYSLFEYIPEGYQKGDDV
ncbi:MAG: transporter substrate-binding domain-containing protein [Lachnospiraceae bacterium]|nr:transporter substrate-binding domain-containing protein [Lachnospiraceae bacterium]